MADEPKPPDGPAQPPPAPEKDSAGAVHDKSVLEKEEAKLWRWVLLFMVFLAAAVAALSWERLENLPYRLTAIPVGLLVLVVLFAAYAYGRKREVSELKILLRGLQDRVGAVPSEDQLDQLSQVIKRSQRSFRELIDSFDDVAFAMSLDGTLRTVNRRMSEITGIPYSQLVGHRLDEFIDEPLRSQAETGIPRFLEKRRWAGLIRLRLKTGGRIFYFDCVLNAILKDDEVVGVSALARDVTEERQKETRFTELFETLHEGVYFSTPEGKVLDANPALVQMLGYSSKDELLATEAGALNFDSGKEPVLGRSLEDRGSVRTREITLRRKDGKAVICLDTSRVVWDPAGQIIRYQGTLVDVTEQRAMEKQLRQQEEFQRNLLESFPDLILVIDPEQHYSFVSSRIRDILGYDADTLRGKKVSPEDQSPEFLELYREVATGKRKFGFCEYGARHHNGSWRTMRASASPLFDAENRIRGVVASVRDITVEKKLEQQIIQSERLAAMGQMIAGFAHELNNPLTSILGISEMLQEAEITETMRKQLVMMHGQARRAAEIVQNLMYFSRPPAPGKTSLNLNELVQRTLHLHAYSLRKNNITVDFVPEATLPPVVGDSNQLMQVFLNLILNAEQAIREVRDKGTLHIRLGRGDGSAWVSFADDGPGIPAENLPNIFDPFYTTKRPGRGTGLGLSICKAVMKEHGGNVEASSTSEGGAVFTVTLPLEDSPPTESTVP
jgi:PAS domain S-box-containing protein